MIERPCTQMDPHEGHVRLNQKWCPGVLEDENYDPQEHADYLGEVPWTDRIEED